MWAYRVYATLMVVAFGVSAWSVRAAELEWKPVSSTAEEYRIIGNEIFIPHGGVEVTLDLLISEWQPHLLRTYQAKVASPDYPDGTGMVEPACDPPALASRDGRYCAFIDAERTDYVFYGTEGPIYAVDTSTLHYRWGGVVFHHEQAVPDTGEPRYGATLIVQVAPDATGTITVGMVGDPHSFLVNPYNEHIKPVTLTPARITIGPLDPRRRWDEVDGEGRDVKGSLGGAASPKGDGLREPRGDDGR
jgi:hypothetical protein